MKRKLTFAGGLLIAASGTLLAQTNTPSAGLLNDWLREQNPEFKKWSLGGQVRLRAEHKENFAIAGVPGAVDFRATGGNTYLLLREKFHVGYTPSPWVSVFAEARDSSAHWDERTPSPDHDRIDLHQAYVQLGNLKEFPLIAKIGRQEFIYGDERVVGAFDWSNVGRVFDAVKLRTEGDYGWIDAFAGRVVIPDDGSFNIANDYDYFSGVYASTKTLIPKQESQLYFLARNVERGSPAALGTGLAPFLTGASPRDIYTLGMRFKSLPGAYGPWDYSFEAAGQLGRFKFSPVAASQDHEAYAVHAGGGHTWKEAFGSPRVGLEYNFASGDENPADGEHQTFENLFPTNHKFYGFMDFMSWQNLHNVRLSGSLKPLKKLTITTDYHAFWMANTSDFFYQVNGAPRSTGGYGINPGAGSYIGSEIDVIATYTIKPYANAQLGYGHFFIGDYVKDSLAGGPARDADWVYAQLGFNF